MGVIKEYFLNSSIHSLHYIADKRFHWIERVFWTICVIGSWAGSLVLMMTAVDQYRTQKISFSIDTFYLNWKTNFPSVIICEQKNNLSIDRVNKFYAQPCKKLALNVAFFDGTLNSDVATNCDEPIFSEVEAIVRSSCQEILQNCFYNKEEFTCCEKFFPLKTYYGYCYAFNSIATGMYKSREDLPYKIYRSMGHSVGNLTLEFSHPEVFVFATAHNSDVTPKTSKLNSESVLSVLQMNYFVSVKETFTTEESRIINIQNRGCRFDDENNLNRSKVYSLSACHNECLVRIQKQVCGCAAHTFPGVSVEEECDLSGLVCIKSSREYTEISNKLGDHCKCVSNCADDEVEIVGSSSAEDSEGFTHFYNPNSKLGMNIIVQPPTIRYTRQVVKTPLSLLVSVGGTVGLFVGASVLTIVDIAYYLVIRPLGNQFLKRGRKAKEMERNVRERVALRRAKARTPVFQFLH